MNSVRFSGNYQVHLTGFAGKKPMSREALEQQVQQMTTQFKVPVQVQYTQSVTDRFRLSEAGEREAYPQMVIDKAQVEFPSAPTGPLPVRELPRLEDLDIYQEKPPKDADEAMRRFLDNADVFYQRVR